MNEFNKIVVLFVFLFLLFFLLGFVLGLLTQQVIFTQSAVKVAEGLEGTNIDLSININETILADRMMELILEDQGR